MNETSARHLNYPDKTWEAIYILDGLIRNRSSVKPTTVHADTQGQNLPVFGLASLLGVELMPRIRNWKDLTFYRPTSTTHYTTTPLAKNWRNTPMSAAPNLFVFNWHRKRSLDYALSTITQLLRHSSQLSRGRYA
jgi:hypothetical protein